MKRLKYFIILGIIVLLASCSASYNMEVDNDVNFLYAKALSELNKGNRIEASESFKKIIDIYPYKNEALEAQVFLIWIYYLDNDYISAEVNIDAFLKYYIYNDYTQWAEYMRALIKYEQMEHVEKNQANVKNALNSFANIIKSSKNKDYVKSAKLKIEVVKYQLAERTMIVARQYLENKQYLAALKRYQEIINYFENSIFIEEAMYRLTYIWLILGVDDEAFRVVSVLGYNYPHSIWYKKSLKLIKNHSKYKDENATIIRNPIN